jgi:hypothetical protein
MLPDSLKDLHTMADLLARCPGMKKEDVYYLEHRGYLRPIKQRHGRVERNLYTTEQAELTAAIWRHRQAGHSPREAYSRAVKERSAGQLRIWEE